MESDRQVEDRCYVRNGVRIRDKPQPLAVGSIPEVFELRKAIVDLHGQKRGS